MNFGKVRYKHSVHCPSMGAVLSKCVRKKPGLSHQTSAERMQGAFMVGKNWLSSYLPVECVNPGLNSSMGKPFPICQNPYLAEVIFQGVQAITDTENMFKCLNIGLMTLITCILLPRPSPDWIEFLLNASKTSLWSSLKNCKKILPCKSISEILRKSAVNRWLYNTLLYEPLASHMWICYAQQCAPPRILAQLLTLSHGSAIATCPVS